MAENTRQEPMLDRRPARSDLTSRECSKMLGGVIEGLCRAFGVDTTRRIVSHYATSDTIWELRSLVKQGETPLPGHKLYERGVRERAEAIRSIDEDACEWIFGSATGAIGLELAELEDVRTAIRWWDKRAGPFWEMMRQLTERSVQ